MTVRMLVNATAPGELRIAIVDDGELIELDIEAAEKSTVKGNIYKGKVRNVEGSLEAAFVDFGQHKQGFLPFSEIAPDQYYRKWDKKERPKINDVVRRDQDILVQVAKDAVGEKGATLTTYLSLPGRYVVLMPGSDAGGISRKIEDEKVRRRIRTMAQKITKPEGCGFIVRTAGLNQTRLGIQKDLDKVAGQLEKIREAAKIARAPSILYAEPDLIARTLRDYFNEDVDEVWVDSREEYEAAVDYFNDVMPDLAERLKHFQNPIPIFAYYHVEEQIEATFERRVALPSGGSIVVDQTEALVAIDVNSGKNTGEGDHENTVFKTNLEAAEEVARQLRLRDLGGIVVVDFIDMEMTRHKREVEKALSDASKDDKARWKISRINSKGLCVLTRQRIRQGMRKAFQRRCEVCQGTGWLRTAESHSLSLLRRIETRLAQGEVGEVRVLTHKETAEYLSNYKRTELLGFEREYRCRIVVMSRPEMDRGKDEVLFLSKGELLAEITDKLPPRERRDAASKRKRKKRRKREGEGEGEGEVMEAESSIEGKSDGKTKRRRRGKDRDRDRERGEGRGESRGERGEARGERAEARGGERPAEEAREVAKEAPKGLEAKGSTTFTGRPSPERLEQLKAERKARMERARARAAGEKVSDEVELPLDGAEADAAALESAAAVQEPGTEGEADPALPAASAKRTRSRRPRKAAPEAPESLPETVGPAARTSAPEAPVEAPAHVEPAPVPAPIPAAKPAPEGERTRKSLLDRIFGSR
jgi:ribonuclease E